MTLSFRFQAFCYCYGFIYCYRQGHLPMVILLLKCGADPSLIDGEGFSSIHLAVLFQHVPIVAYLISKGQVRCQYPRCYFLLRSSWLYSENTLWNLSFVS